MSKNQKKLYIGISVAIFLILVISLFGFQAEKERLQGENQSRVTDSETPSKTEVYSPSLPENERPKPKTSSKVAEQPAAQSAQNTEEPKNTETDSESVTVIAGDVTVLLKVAPGTVFYDALIQAKSQGQLSFEGKKYSGLGFLVTDIGNLHSGNGKYLLYYINGKEAAVGVSNYTLKDGDVIEWKLE